jgi:hypothetical protein
VQLNMEYGSRKKGGAWSMIIIIITGTYLYGRNVDGCPLLQRCCDYLYVPSM